MSSSVFQAVFIIFIVSRSYSIETSADQKPWDTVNGPWVKAQPRPPTPTWPDQFVTGFYLYIQKLGEDFKSQGSIYYDYTEKVANS